MTSASSEMSNSKQCETCKELQTIPEGRGEPRWIELSEELFENTVCGRKKYKNREIFTFCKHMNAFLNNGSGVAFAHTESPQLLGLFKEAVCEKLSCLISDNSCYTDNFEIVFVDIKHVLFRVKSLETRLFSFLSFNSKISVDKGVSDPTHGQFFYLLRFLESLEQSPELTRRLVFHQDNHYVDIRENITSSSGETFNTVFYEGVGIEAKSFAGLKAYDIRNKTDDLFLYMWGFLPNYISAFSKLPAGGSVYFGLFEEKKRDKSKQVTGYFLYEDELSLTDIERDRLRKKIRDAASTLYVNFPNALSQHRARQPHPGTSAQGATTQTPGSQKDLVQVKYHDTPKSSGHCVVEVVIAMSPGLVFTGTNGPESYALLNNKPVSVPAEISIGKVKRRRVD